MQFIKKTAYSLEKRFFLLLWEIHLVWKDDIIIPYLVYLPLMHTVQTNFQNDNNTCTFLHVRVTLYYIIIPEIFANSMNSEN